MGDAYGGLRLRIVIVSRRIANVSHLIKDVEHHTANESDAYGGLRLRIADVSHLIRDVGHHTANVSRERCLRRAASTHC